VPPLAVVDEFLFGLSVTMAFGFSIATILQLWVVPMLYSRIMGKRLLREHHGK